MKLATTSVSVTILLAVKRTALGQEGRAQNDRLPESILSEDVGPPEAAATDLILRNEVLEGQIQLLLHDSDRILSTALWTLGISGAIVIAALGLFAFFSIRSFDRERNALSTELRSIITEEIAAIRSEIVQHSEAERREHSERVSAMKATLTDVVMTQVAGGIRPFDNAVRRLRVAHNGLIGQLLELRAKFALEHGPELTALSAYIRYIHYAIDAKHYGLGLALKDLQILVGRLRPLLPSYEADIAKLLQKVPDEHSLIRDRIATLLRDGAPAPGAGQPEV